MLTRLHVRNLKRFDDAVVELGPAVVLIGPNNSGKSTALQALALWEAGVRRWNEKRKGKTSPKKRPGVTINRRDLIAIPVPDANLLWRDLHVRNVEQVVDKETGDRKPKTENVRIDIIVDGITEGRQWSCGMEFDYANEESLYCRPLRQDDSKKPERMTVPPEAGQVRVAFLPPMSGLAAVEPKWEPGRINVLIGEGQTAQVLRNLCYQIHSGENGQENWSRLAGDIRSLFGVQLLPPSYIAERGEITMTYKEPNGVQLDISSSGRGLQQTLLLLAHLYANPRTVLLLDEPDAHLEILRQRQIYQLLTTVAGGQGSQVVAASHSEVVLNEAADRDTVVAFVGRPHRMGDRGSQVLKALRDIGFDQYYQAEQTGWVLYLEDATDLAILQAFAKTLDHEAQGYLEMPFLHRIATNQPQRARDHFYGLREAKEDLVGIALFDRLDKELDQGQPLRELMWRRREIENYFCMEEVLLEYARYDVPDDLFGLAERDRRVGAMREVIADFCKARQTQRQPGPWSSDIKASDEFLDPVFQNFFEKLVLPLGLRKSDYHRLAALVPKEQIDPEVVEKLNAIVEAANLARPRGN
ncbi:MAG: AAA family ATPase [Phycisphaerae bacterium]|nr:AAA family ATPase [Phycisphaerae bacterium]